VEISQNFIAFSEYMNFIKSGYNSATIITYIHKLIDRSILPLYLRPLVKFKFRNRKIRQINALNGTDVW
jgi:hypothetical protein